MYLFYGVCHAMPSLRERDDFTVKAPWGRPDRCCWHFIVKQMEEVGFKSTLQQQRSGAGVGNLDSKQETRSPISEGFEGLLCCFVPVPTCRRTSSPLSAGRVWLPSHTSCLALHGCTGSSWRRGTWSLPSHSVSVVLSFNCLDQIPHTFIFIHMCVFSIGHVDNSQTVHMRVLQTIYKRLIGCRLDCPRYGAHWENIGFQGKAWTCSLVDRRSVISPCYSCEPLRPVSVHFSKVNASYCSFLELFL